MYTSTLVLLLLGTPFSFQDNVPNETSLEIARLITARAEGAGLTLNGISHRQPRLEEEGFTELRTYLGFDGDDQKLQAFLNALDEAPINFGVESLNLSSRRETGKRAPLHGHMVLMIPARKGFPIKKGHDEIKGYDTQMVRALLNSVRALMNENHRLVSLVIKERNQVTLFVDTRESQSLSQALKEMSLIADLKLRAKPGREPGSPKRIIATAILQFGE